jgi:hypothetical protein
MIIRGVIAAVLVVAGGGAVGAGAACGGGGASSARQERTNVSNDANHQLLQVSAHPSLEILIRIGTQHWQAGELTLVVHGSGSVEVTQRQAAATTSFGGVLPKADLDALGRELGAHRFTAARTSVLPREPGDTPVVLTLRHDGEVTFEAQIWNADRDVDADLDAILRAAERLIYRVSAGKLGQPT